MIFSEIKFPLFSFAVAFCFSAFVGAEETNLSSEETQSPEIKNSVAPEKFSTARTDFFEISAESPQTATRAAELAEEVENYFLKNPRLWKTLLPPLGFRVRVELFRQSGILRLSKTENGCAQLFLSENFSEKSASGTMRLHFARAMILHLVPVKNPADIPAWLVYAAADESRIGSVPGRRIFLQKKSTRESPVSPEKILSATVSELNDNPTLRLNALWFSRAIPSLSPFFDSAKTPEEKLLAAFPKAFADEKYDVLTADKFWATRFRSLIANAPTGIDLPEESRRFFDDALLILIKESEHETRLLAGDLAPFRLQPEIRETVSERLAALSAHFKKVNPVWHNAFAEYGLFLEMFINPDVDAGTLESQWNKAILSRAEAVEVQNDLENALKNTNTK